MKKRILSLLCVFCLMLTMLPTSAFAAGYDAPTLSIDASYLAETNQVKMSVKIGAYTDLGALDFHVKYDKEKLKVNGTPTKGGLLTANSTVSDNNSWNPATIGVSWVDENGSTTTTTTEILTVIFDVIEGKTGAVDFSFDEAKYNFCDKSGDNSTDVPGAGSVTSANATIPKAPISSVTIADLDAPVKGAAPDTSVTVTPSSLTADVKWFDGATPVTGNFAASTKYTVKIKLTASGGDNFAETVTAGDYTVTRNSETELLLTRTFPKTNDKDPLTGTVSITGSPKIGQPLTADTSALPSDATGLTYQWYRVGTTESPITDAMAKTYTPTKKDDVNKKIKVVVTAENYSGSVTATTADAVAKAAGPVAPAGLAEVSKTDTTITVTPNAAWEYSKDNGATWQDSNVFTGLTANTTYSQIVARVKATGTHEASTACTAISVTTAKSSATITIDDPGTIVYDGSAVEAGTSGKDLNYTNSGDGAVTVKWYADNGGSVGSELSGAPTNAGTYWIGVSAAEGTSSAAVSEVTKKFTISRAAYTYTYTGTTAASIGSARPTSGSATANGVGVESVSGTLTWYTDSACTNPAAGNFTATGTEDLYWQFAPAASEKNYVTTLQTGKVTFHVTALPAQTVTFADPGPIAKNFGDANFLNTANNSTPSGGAITYSVDNTAVAEVNSTGEVTIKGAGTATITATAAATTGYAETKVSYTLNVSPKTITPSIVLHRLPSSMTERTRNPLLPYMTGRAVLPSLLRTTRWNMWTIGMPAPRRSS